ncbi:MAG: MBL fold metallo-hydrolase [Pseudomonadota bacterium]
MNTRWSLLGILLTAHLVALLGAAPAHSFEVRNYCGDEGVWVHTLGGGGPELTDDQGAASYLIWQDGAARVLIDPAPGSSLLFDKTEARFEDLEVMLFSQLKADRIGDFPAFVSGSEFGERTEPLRVFGPTGAAPYPDTTDFVARLFGSEGAYPHLSAFLENKPASQGGYKVIAQNVPARGRREWSGYGNDRLELRAVPVNHGPVPSLAWRVDIGGHSIVFTGNFNNAKNLVPALASDVDALVIHHAVPENSRGPVRELHVVPSQIGRIANQAQPRMLVLGQRMNRTRGVESLSRQKIEAEYDGSLIFANDMECWGL